MFVLGFFETGFLCVVCCAGDRLAWAPETREAAAGELKLVSEVTCFWICYGREPYFSSGREDSELLGLMNWKSRVAFNSVRYIEPFTLVLDGLELGVGGLVVPYHHRLVVKVE